ncbi:MAG: hypothetical protein H0T73_13050, partial [Ardenticatenales bacterium]|nr:hypothetical protein [Ardenticatenales bacterium]
EQYGILAFYQDPDNYYAFLISSEGSFSVKKRIKGKWTEESDWISSDAIKVKQGQINKIEIVSKGDDIQFYVNDEYLTTIANSDFDEGGIAMVTGARTEGTVAISFDNLLVSRLR